MPRDSSGNYTLPPGNPVIDGTIIDVNWANPTLSDVAVQLNNLITRDGLLGATAPIKFNDGTLALPGITWASEATMGWYRPTANTTVLTIQGAARQIWTTTANTILTDLSVSGALGVTGATTIGGHLTISGTTSFTGDLDSTGNLTITQNFDGFAGVVSINNSAGASAAAGYRGTNNAGKQATLISTGSGYTGIPAAASTSLLYSDTVQGHWIMAALAGSIIRFAAGGGTEQMRLTDDGRLCVGSAGFGGIPFTVKVGTDQTFGVFSLTGGTTLGAFTDGGSAAPLRIAGQVIAFSGNGGSTDQGFIKNTGNWGIGPNTSDAPYKLTVGHGSETSNEIHLRNSAASLSLITIDNSGGGVLCSAVNDSGSAFIGIASGTAGFAANTKPIVFAVANVERMRIDTSGQVGIGITPNGNATVQIASANRPLSAGTGQLCLQSTDSQAADKGGSLQFGGGYSGTSDTTFASVSGRKENSTNANIAGYLAFATNDASAGPLERMRLDSTGKLGIGKTPTFQIDATFAGQAVFRLGYTGASEIYLQANSSSDVRMGSLTAHPTIIVSNGTARLTVPVATGDPILYTLSGVQYIASVDPGSSGPAMPIGSVIFGAATGVTGGALNGLGTSTLGGAVTLSVQAYSGGSPQVTNVGTWRNIGAQTSGIGLWQRVA